MLRRLLSNFNWLAFAAIVLALAAIVVAVIYFDPRTFAIVLGLVAIVVALLVIADFTSQ